MESGENWQRPRRERERERQCVRVRESLSERKSAGKEREMKIEK